MRLLPLLTGLALLLVACEPRRPLVRGEAVGKADSFQRAIGVDWGTPLTVLPPDGADQDGRRWWQVSYRPGDDGSDRIILVDHDSGWARRPPPGWTVRRERADPGKAPDELKPGADLLIVATAPERGAEDLAREVERLNALATETGLAPLFSLRDARGEHQIVYGWRDDAGIHRDDAVRDWLRLRTPYNDAYWVSLAQ